MRDLDVVFFFEMAGLCFASYLYILVFVCLPACLLVCLFVCLCLLILFFLFIFLSLLVAEFSLSQEKSFGPSKRKGGVFVERLAFCDVLFVL